MEDRDSFPFQRLAWLWSAKRPPQFSRIYRKCQERLANQEYKLSHCGPLLGWSGPIRHIHSLGYIDPGKTVARRNSTMESFINLDQDLLKVFKIGSYVEAALYILITLKRTEKYWLYFLSLKIEDICDKLKLVSGQYFNLS